MEMVVNVEGAPKPVGPYSPAVKVNGFIFCAGQIALDPDTGALVPGGIDEQAHRVLRNLQAVLTASGSSYERVVMTTVFLSEIADARRVNEIYTQYVSPQALPARQTVAVKELPLGALVEISLVAVYS